MYSLQKKHLIQHQGIKLQPQGFNLQKVKIYQTKNI